jgi:hyperosmotically inducible protein
MRTFSKTLMTAGLIAAFAALPLAQAAAQDATSQTTTTQTTETNSQKTDQTVPGKVDDAWITTKVKSEFATTKAIHATDISVDTMDGKVTLTGSVGSKHEKNKAVRVAKHVKGVKSVDASGLTVNATTKTTTTSTTTEQPASSSTSGQ